MILRKALDIRKSIDDYRQELHELTKKKGHTDPDVIQIRQQLEEKILMLKKIIYEIRSLSMGIFPC